MELSMSMKQTQTLSPQMMQSMEILQMGSQELLEYIQDQVQENPVLEMEEKYGKGDDTAVLQRKLEWLESTDAQNRYYHQQDTEDDEKDPISNYGTVDEREENLYLYVLSQLEVMDLEPELLPVGRFLVESLNQNGWLDESVEDLAEELGIPVQESVRTGGSTNGAPIHLSNQGVPVIVIGIPVRYIHTHYGIAAHSDVENAARLAAAILERMDAAQISRF